MSQAAASRSDPKIDNHEITIGRLGDLRLKRIVRRIIGCFPADRADADAARIFVVEPLDDEIDPLALAHHIAGRRDEDLEFRGLRHGRGSLRSRLVP